MCSAGFLFFMTDLLLDEEDFRSAIEDILAFAEKHGLEYDGSSSRLIEITLTLMMAMEDDPEAFVLLGKLIYNIGYRDNFFKRQVVVH